MTTDFIFFFSRGANYFSFNSSKDPVGFFVDEEIKKKLLAAHRGSLIIIITFSHYFRDGVVENAHQ